MPLNINHNTSINPYQRNAAFLAFLILIFVSYFGTAAPFPEHYESADESTSNIYNQVIYILIFLLSLYSIQNKKKQLVNFIIKEKFLSLLIFWYFLGMLWSIDPFATFKLSFRLSIIVLVMISFFLHYSSYNDTNSLIKYIAALFIIINFFAVFTIPGAKDTYGFWRGTTLQKNILGQISVFTIIIYFDLLIKEKRNTTKIVALIMISLSTIILFGSRSSTSLIGLLIFCFLVSVKLFDKIFRSLGAGKFVSSTLVLGVLSSVMIVLVFFPSILDILTSLFGKDPSFTGRTELWYIAIQSIEKHFPLGTALGAFWNSANNDLAEIHILFPWLPMQSHSGFLDLLNEGGIIGFIFFLGLTLKYLWLQWKLEIKSLWFYLIIVILIINSQETLLLVPGNLATMLFLLGYIKINMSVNETTI